MSTQSSIAMSACFETENPVCGVILSCQGSQSRPVAPAEDMAQDGVTNTGQMIVVSTVEGWLSFKSLLQHCSGDKNLQFSGLMGPEAEAEEREQEFELNVLQQEERREREMEELTAKHAEERKKEASERMQYGKKKENSKEAMISHRAMLQPKNPTDDENTKTTSVILLGLSGSGKSSALNLILEIAGNQYFVNESTLGNSLPTLSCERKEVFKSGRKLILVDTPELWDEDGVENLDLVKDCLSLSLPGPHVFLVVLQVGRFTHGECEMLVQLQKMFGRELTEYAIVLFVSFDDSQQRPQRIDDYVEEAHVTLQDLIRKCGSRFYELNVTKSQSALSFPQVKDLLLGINKLVASHGGQAYSGRRFSMQELRERRKHIEEMKEGALENDSLLRDS
ncbi:GTPase IMAP family member 8-like isoform X2 [Notolabrus celidotus]|uniref:GTPase IMAP family member 8-like isoform X2 n=1 Tax=Notolabrus celidotus TaxID=1203425 RepID=UPI00148F9DE3|nr:GTPase IMAP family member 8-like isoform X2 [Notolabrus celidotus]